MQRIHPAKSCGYLTSKLTYLKTIIQKTLFTEISIAQKPIVKFLCKRLKEKGLRLLHGIPCIQP